MKSDILAFLSQSLATFLIFALALFLPAGRADWLAGWVFLAMFFVWYFALNIWLFRHNPALVHERLRMSRPDQKGWDKVVFPLLLIASVGWLVFIAFDAGRFHWSSEPAWLQIVGAVVMIFSFALFSLTFRENSFLSTVVRVQEERGHSVISTGPYRYVRHPMYAAILVFVIGVPLQLGSLYGVLLGLLYMVALARRAVMEERTLRRELRGYSDYMEKVRFRLIPRVW